MKKLSEKQRQRHLRLMNKKVKTESKRKVRRKLVLEKLRRINVAHRKIAKAQRRMLRLAKQG
jgi:hypothetical protein